MMLKFVKMRVVGGILILFSLCFAGNAQKLVVHPVPDSIEHNNDYTVKVRLKGGEWQDLFEYQAQVDMHNVRNTSMVTFDFEGTIEVQVKCNRKAVKNVRIRPLSYGIKPERRGNTVTFSLSKPCNLSLEVNGDIFHNLQLFSNPLETFKPEKNDTNVVFLGPGIHYFPKGTLQLSSDKTLYLEGGAILKARVLCHNVSNVSICGRGIIYQPETGVEVSYSSNVKIEDVIFINSQHYTVSGGQSNHIDIKNIRSFSSKGWSDGIDMMSCSDVTIEGVFMRNSDDCIAIYCHRWNYFGNCFNILVKNSTLWADVAHPIFIGTHGNPLNPETFDNLTFSNIDILNHDEPQLNYQGCMAINVSDENLARNIRFEDIRVDDFEEGQLINLRVTFNKKYATAAGRGIENVYFRNITYNGKNSNFSVFEGYNESRNIKNVVFENLIINGKVISNQMDKPSHFQLSDMARFYIGPHVDSLEFLSSKIVNK
jgi:hypothetical protein